MRVLMISKACIVGIYQRKLEAMARLGVELLVLVPPAWRDERGLMPLERAYTAGYRLETTPIRLNGNFHLHYYPELRRWMREYQPEIVHIDEEPYNLAAWQSLYETRRAGAKSLFFSWQNLNRQYPPPFSWGERWALRQVDQIIAGTESAAQVWRAKGYAGPMRVIPQFGVDPAMFVPQAPEHARPFTIGYVGRLVEEKGIEDLLRAAQRLNGGWRVQLVGGGPLRNALGHLAADLGIGTRVRFRDQVASVEMPSQYRELDVLVLPSRGRANWKEQFGRVLVEAMASGVPVIGSDSGAIPDVIGEAGLLFPEGDVEALAGALARLQQDASLRQRLAAQGRERVVRHFTHEQVAAATVDVYKEMLGVEPREESPAYAELPGP